MAVELVDPGRNISYVRGQLVPGNFAGGSNNDGHFVDTISNGNTVERSVSATGWVQSFASALGNKDTFSLKYSVTVEQAQKKNGALKDGVASLGVAMAPRPSYCLKRGPPAELPLEALAKELSVDGAAT